MIKMDAQNTPVEQLKKDPGFAAYLASKERKDSFKSNPEFGNRLLRERLAEVTHADVANYFG